MGKNGPIRQIPGTHTLQQNPPPPGRRTRLDETFNTRRGKVLVLGVFRDNRAWHGATPNLSREIRGPTKC